MEFSVLGTLTARDGDVDVTPSAPKLRRVLATLLLRANKLVLADTLAEELWQDNPPTSATATLQTYIYQLRKAFGSDRRESIIGTRTEPSGYVLSVDPADVDLMRFQSLIREGRRALKASRLELASRVLHEALGLWQGPVFGGVLCGPVLQSHATFLEEERMNALELRIDADLQLGRHRELVSELKTLVVSHPLHEWFQSRLMTALHSSSRQGEALEVYRCYRRQLRDELGLEPGLEMQRAQQDILNSTLQPVH